MQPAWSYYRFCIWWCYFVGVNCSLSPYINKYIHICVCTHTFIFLALCEFVMCVQFVFFSLWCSTKSRSVCTHSFKPIVHNIWRILIRLVIDSLKIQQCFRTFLRFFPRTNITITIFVCGFFWWMCIEFLCFFAGIWRIFLGFFFLRKKCSYQF